MGVRKYGDRRQAHREAVRRWTKRHGQTAKQRAFWRKAKDYDVDCLRSGIPRARDVRRGMVRGSTATEKGFRSRERMRAASYAVEHAEHLSMMMAYLNAEDAEMRLRYGLRSAVSQQSESQQKSR